MKVSERWALYREHGLEVARGTVWGPLTPELVDALGRLRDTLVVSEVMESCHIGVVFEVPDGLEPAFRAAIVGQNSLLE